MYITVAYFVIKNDGEKILSLSFVYFNNYSRNFSKIKIKCVEKKNSNYILYGLTV